MELEIVKLDDFGRGIGYINGKITFVANTLPKDVVSIKNIEEHKKYNVGYLDKIIKRSDLRVKGKCPKFLECGGCVLQNLSYLDTINYKLNKVINYYKKYNIIIKPELIINDNPYNYRNKITLKIKDGVIGFYKENSHLITEVNSCDIAEDCINDVISTVGGWEILNGEVIIRCNYKKEILIIINSKDKLNISNISNNIKGIIVNDEVIVGDNYFIECVNDIKYKVSYNAFFQVNRLVAGKMFLTILEFLDSKDSVLDLYSGVGTLGLTAALVAKSVVGVEINECAVMDALENARVNNINNAKFIYSDASLIGSIDVSFNKLIVDPPRAGLSREVIEFIKKRLPDEVIYISCDYHTQVRDILLLEDYEVVKSYVVDLFSYTYHVEVICVLRRKNI